MDESKMEESDFDYSELVIVPLSSEIQIETVKVGATRSEGGTRSRSILMGGSRSMPFHDSRTPLRNPIIAFDVFDIPISLPRPIKEHYSDVLENPAEWAKRCVEKFGADMVTIHLISTDPSIKDTSAREAAKVVEEVLQAISVPIIIGGSGNPQKDTEVLEKAAEVAEGERVVINSANLNSDYRRIAKACISYGHVVLSWTQLNLNDQIRLNRFLFQQGIGRNDLLMDPTTAPLGYGFEYTFSIMERIRIAALQGEEDLQMPVVSGTTNSWGAREAWMKSSPFPEENWGDISIRGNLWEAITAFCLFLAGCDLFMMMCPTSISYFRDMVKSLLTMKDTQNALKWVGGLI